MGGQEEGGELSCCGGVIMKQIKFQSRTERVLRSTYVVMYAFWSKKELVPVFQSNGTLVPFGIPAESGPNVQPCPKRVDSFGYSTDFLTRRSVTSDIDSVRKL